MSQASHLKPEIPDSALHLIQRYLNDRDQLESNSYKEYSLRNDFINPLFRVLGWDVENQLGIGEKYRDVQQEPTVRVGRRAKAPDYCFRIGGIPKFFLEAKKPFIDIASDADSAFQLRRYGWSANLPISVLTNFRQLAIYDCRFPPKKDDPPNTARVRLLSIEQYHEHWSESFASLLSHDAVASGSVSRFFPSARRRDRRQVDVVFLKEIESWRSRLAEHIKRLNPELTIDELNFSVQTLIDRIVFLRVCEDRGIEMYSQLDQIRSRTPIYKELLKLFQRADDRYNSGLFHFREEKDRVEIPDRLSQQLKIQDDILDGILGGLYYPDSPYEFSVVPSDLLGQVYEQFLGKVITLDAQNQAIIEEKPEVRRAGGIYYTPTTIVRYIVHNALGEYIAGLSLQAISELRLVDPSCGSGTFLLEAYQYLLEWYRKMYEVGDPTKRSRRLYQRAGGKWALTTAERKRILTAHIFGVDIDPQAVEVTKLSLLLKVLEGEDEETINNQLKLFHERALPDLGENIHCGNALMGSDIFLPPNSIADTKENRDRIRPFDWHSEFPGIFNRTKKGFNVVIGNPPYIGFHGFKPDKQYLRNKYVSARGKFDYYLPFIETALNCLAPGGVMGYICPTNFMKRAHGASLRRLLCQATQIDQICDFEDVQIFEDALNYTGIFVISKTPPSTQHQILYKRRSLDDQGQLFPQNRLGEDPWVVRSEMENVIIGHILSRRVDPLSAMTMGISEGIVTGKNEVFLIDANAVNQIGLESDIMRPCHRGREIEAYDLGEANEQVIYPYVLNDGRTKAIPEPNMRSFPKTYNYLKTQKENLAGRGYMENSTKHWYELWCPRDLEQLAQRKIVVPELATHNQFAIAPKDVFYGDTVCGITLLPDVPEKMEYLLGLLNSKLIEYFYKKTTVPKANGFYIYKTMFLGNIPVRRINFESSVELELHNQIVTAVIQLSEKIKTRRHASTPHEATMLDREISQRRSHIDQFVYRLYEVDADSIRKIEDFFAVDESAIP